MTLIDVTFLSVLGAGKVGRVYLHREAVQMQGWRAGTSGTKGQYTYNNSLVNKDIIVLDFSL